MTTKRVLVFFSSVLTVAPMRVSFADQDAGPEDARFTKLAAHSEHVRRYFQVKKPDDNFEIDPERLERAFKNSAAWVRALLREQFVPEDLDSLMQGVPAGLAEVDRERGGKWPRFDCTTVEFESGGHRFRVVQDSMSVAFFVSSAKFERRAAEGTGDAFARVLRDWTKELFRHAEVSLYLSPICLTDFGVDTPRPATAWNHLDNRWRPNVVKSPKAWEDGLMLPPEWLFHDRQHDHDRLAAKLLELDPTIPEEQLKVPEGHWWRAVNAATDGNVLYFGVAKVAGLFQSPGPPQVPDWFRVIDTGEIPMSGKDKTGQPASRGREPAWPPK